LERRFERTERAIASIKGETPTLNRAKVHQNMLNLIASDEGNEQLRNDYALRRLDDKPMNRTVDDDASNGIFQMRSKWMDAEYLQGCDRGLLKPAEEEFWDGLIDKYLKPLEKSPAEEKQIATELANLRNRIAFSLILLNGLLVLAVFLLQRHKDVLSVKFIPYEGFSWTKMNETTGRFEQTTEALKVDPLGLGIIFFLFGILIIQTIGMVIHRLNTLVEAMHEISELEVVKLASAKFKGHAEVLQDARLMLDTANYKDAHGGTGYTGRRMAV